MLKYDRRKLLDQPNLRTAEEDLNSTTRYAMPSMTASPSHTLGQKGSPRKPISKKLARSKPAVGVPNARGGEYRTYPFTDSYNENALKD
jgi:hypothetical protein